jgi:hypothetical protein
LTREDDLDDALQTMARAQVRLVPVVVRSAVAGGDEAVSGGTVRTESPSEDDELTLDPRQD